MTPTVGHFVLYTLSETDVYYINKRRKDAAAAVAAAGPMRLQTLSGTQLHVGNEHQAGEVVPMIIVRVWGDQPESHFNGQVFLDGNDTYWVQSVRIGEGRAYAQWPPRPDVPAQSSEEAGARAVTRMLRCVEPYLQRETLSADLMKYSNV
jgi:hypothetical protein